MSKSNAQILLDMWLEMLHQAEIGNTKGFTATQMTFINCYKHPNYKPHQGEFHKLLAENHRSVMK